MTVQEAIERLEEEFRNKFPEYESAVRASREATAAFERAKQNLSLANQTLAKYEERDCEYYLNSLDALRELTATP